MTSSLCFPWQAQELLYQEVNDDCLADAKQGCLPKPQYVLWNVPRIIHSSMQHKQLTATLTYVINITASRPMKVP